MLFSQKPGSPSSFEGSPSSSVRPTAVPHLSLHAEQAAIRSCLHFNARQALSSLDRYFLPVSSSSSVPTFRSSPPPPRGKKRTRERPEDVCRGTTLYVGRWNAVDGPGMTAKPCWRCIQTMHQFGVRSILWTVSAPEVLPDKAVPGPVAASLFAAASLASPAPTQATTPEQYYLGDNGQFYAEAKIADLWRAVQEASDLETSGFLTLAEEFALKQERKRLAADAPE